MKKGQEPNYYKIFESIARDDKLSPEEIDECAFELIQAFSWVVPTEEALNKIAEFSHIVEIGAGRGYWAKLYSKLVQKVKCYDAFPPQHPYYPVAEGGPFVLRFFEEPWTLLICSPQYRSDMVLESLRYYPGRNLIYIGDTKFSMNLPSVESVLKTEWKQLEEIDLPNWPNSDNKLLVYERRE